MIKGLISADAADGKGERVRKDITISQGQERSKLQEPERGKQTKEESKEQTSKALLGSKRDKEDESKPTDSKPASFKSKRQGRKHQVQEQSQFPKHVASTSSMPKPKRCGRGGNILLSNLSYVWEMLFGASS